MGNTYRVRIYGNRAQNIELAIYTYNLALEVYERSKVPLDWAMMQNNLGNAYSDRMIDKRAQNIEKAIKSYDLALEVYKREDSPFEWATVQNNLGSSYSDRILCDRAQNIESAISAYNLALEVRTHKDFPIDWAMTQNNLGNAYRDRILGDPAQNIKIAITKFNQALEVYSYEHSPFEWATVQNNLGNAYSKKTLDDRRTENLKAAINSYKLALKVRTRKDFPEDWAMTQNNLGDAYRENTLDNPAQNIDAGIKSFKLALETITREDFPLQWSMLQNNLGYAYLKRIRGVRIINMKAAIKAFNLAIEVRDSLKLHHECFQTGNNLGSLGFNERMWEVATKGYEIAIKSVEQIRISVTDDQRREAIQEQAIESYTNVVQAYINLEQYHKALEYLERSRSRRLVELMSNEGFYDNADVKPEVRVLLEKYEAKQREINALLPFLQSDNRSLIDSPRSNRAIIQAYTQEIKQLEAEKQEIWKQLRKEDPVIATQIQVAPISFTEIQSLVKDNPKAAILSFNTTATDIIIFITTASHPQPIFFHCTLKEKIDINEWIKNEWLGKYLNPNNRKEWQDQMPQFLTQLSEILQLDLLISRHLQNIDELIIIPHLYLHQIPFAALPISGKDKYLGDHFKLRYAPSPQILKFCQERGDSPFIETSQSFGTLENSREDLMFAQFEGEQLAKILNINASDRLQGKKGATTLATKNLLKKVSAFTTSNHAVARLDNPLESMIPLGDGAITLGQLLTSRFPQLYDVFMSSCEGSLGEAKTLTDDQVTLGMGFLSAGARAVISALWEIDDLAAAVFSILYHQKRKAGSDRISALQSTQQEIREMTRLQLHNLAKEWELQPYLDEKIDLADKEVAEKLAAQNTILKSIDNEKAARASADNLNIASELIQEPKSKKAQQIKPFASPYYWAAFTCQGLG